MRALLKAARDPAWQMIGVVVAVLLTLFAASTAEKGRSELSVVHHSRTDLSRQWLPDAKFRVLHENSTYDINRSILDYYVLTNESSKPIEPGDFFEPLEVEVGSTGLSLVSVENCSASAAQACSVDSRPQGGNFVSASWARDGDRWRASPLLINSGEKICVIVVSERVGEDLSAIAAERPSWSSRICGMNLVQYKSLQAYAETLPRTLSAYLYVSVYMETEGIVWFTLLFATLFFAYLQLATISGWLNSGTLFGPLKVVALGLVSVTTAEILVDAFVNGNNADQLHPIVWPLLAIAALFFCFLAASALRTPRSQKAG